MDEKLPPPSPEQQQAQLQRERESRRTFLMKIGMALNGLVALGLAVPVVRYLFGPVGGKNEYLRWIAVGDANNFREGETTLISFRNPITEAWDGETSKIPAYVRRESASRFTVFAINCAHLGCPVRWFPESQLFMCPCHGGVYYADGSRASGPPERGLFIYPTRIENGKLLIDAGQIPTFATQARLIQEIKPCPKMPNPGTSDSTIG
jgi:Rieske Fe-S protein